MSQFYPLSGIYTPPPNLPPDAYGPGAATALNVATATVLKANPGGLVRIDVVSAGSTAGPAYDTNSTSFVAARIKYVQFRTSSDLYRLTGLRRPASLSPRQFEGSERCLLLILRSPLG